jgi:hypothetical protein
MRGLIICRYGGATIEILRILEKKLQEITQSSNDRILVLFAADMLPS